MSCQVVVGAENHEKLRLELMAVGRRLFAAADDEAFRLARSEVAAYCFERVLPHLDRDERWLTRAAECPEARLLAGAMRAEARSMRAAAHELAAAADRCEAVAATRVVHTLLAAHTDHEASLQVATRHSVR